MRFRYDLVPSPQPVASLGGRFVRPRPLVDVSVTGPSSTRLCRALLDSGADDTVFPDWMAAAIGVDLTNVPSVTIRLATAGRTVSVRYVTVTLRMTDGQEMREWPAVIACTPSPLHYPLLGFGGCLQFFDATFRGAIEQVELTTNALYPGT
jgi:hypothetical protein